jgi:glycosyltransferase involved in cell wall biosynthesis
MKLLIITQKVDKNAPILGFFHGWLLEFARQVDAVEVICLYEGDHDLPQNVRVHSLGKERGVGRLGYVMNFYSLLWKLRNDYDHVFVHMTPQYIVLAGFYWRLVGRCVSLWYMHKSTPWYLRMAMPFTDIIFTGTKNSFRLVSDKVKVVGHGIDTIKFHISNNIEKKYDIITVGRMSPVKHVEVLIEAVKKLKERGESYSVAIVGGPATEADIEYEKNMKQLVVDYGLGGSVLFLGHKTNDEVSRLLPMARIFVSMSETGSIDKALLEPMAVGVPVLGCSDSLPDVLGSLSDRLVYPAGDIDSLVRLIDDNLKNLNDELGAELSELIQKNHSLDRLVWKILSFFSSRHI